MKPGLIPLLKVTPSSLGQLKNAPVQKLGQHHNKAVSQFRPIELKADLSPEQVRNPSMKLGKLKKHGNDIELSP
jgi:hypothetical protein